MVYRSLDICKFCYAQRVLERKPQNKYEAVFMLKALEFDPANEKSYSPFLCRYEMEGWSAEKKLPKECPYFGAHFGNAECLVKWSVWLV